jgi:hypothetical protein
MCVGIVCGWSVAPSPVAALAPLVVLAGVSMIATGPAGVAAGAGAVPAALAHLAWRRALRRRCDPAP